MRIVALSDTHGLHRRVEIPEGDVLIHAGDWMNSGNHIQEASEFAKWWNTQPHTHKILIGGNHDRYLEAHPAIILPLFENTRYLENSATEIDGVKFWGSPRTPEFMNWAFMYPSGEGSQYWDQIPDDVDVLITHGPPLHVLDTSVLYGENLGCPDLAKRVDVVKPKVHIFGHIHGGRGEEEIFGTRFYNAAICNESYRPVYKPYVIDVAGTNP